MLALRMKNWYNCSGSPPCLHSGWRWKQFGLWIRTGILTDAWVIFRWVFEFGSRQMYLSYVIPWDNHSCLSESPFIHLQHMLTFSVILNPGFHLSHTLFLCSEYLVARCWKRGTKNTRHPMCFVFWIRFTYKCIYIYKLNQIINKCFNYNRQNKDGNWSRYFKKSFWNVSIHNIYWYSLISCPWYLIWIHLSIL